MCVSLHCNFVLQGKTCFNLVYIGVFAVFYETHCGYNQDVVCTIGGGLFPVAWNT
jgi:hypothetical protein